MSNTKSLVKVPFISESSKEFKIIKWHKNNGDVININDVISELESEKEIIEITSPAFGKLKILLSEGQIVTTSSVICEIIEYSNELKTTDLLNKETVLNSFKTI